MNLAHTLTGDYVICYQIQQETDHVKLRLWEPAARTNRSASEHPFLYAINFSFERLADAEAFLREYLLVNGAFDVPESCFPAEGQVEILPYPTWGLEHA